MRVYVLTDAWSKPAELEGNYAVAESRDLHKLAALVCSAAQYGWRAEGGVTFIPPRGDYGIGSFIQVMVR